MALALNDADRSIVCKARLPWDSGELAVSHSAMILLLQTRPHPNVEDFTMVPRHRPKRVPTHLVAFSSSTINRVCRGMLRCEAYSLQHATEHGGRIRAAFLEIQGKLPVSAHWEDIARISRLHDHVQYIDSRSLSDHLLPPIPRQVEDKRLSTELAGLRQSLWKEDVPSHIYPYGDDLRWVPTLADRKLLYKVYEAEPPVEHSDQIQQSSGARSPNIRRPTSGNLPVKTTPGA